MKLGLPLARVMSGERRDLYDFVNLSSDTGVWRLALERLMLGSSGPGADIGNGGLGGWKNSCVCFTGHENMWKYEEDLLRLTGSNCLFLYDDISRRLKLVILRL